MFRFRPTVEALDARTLPSTVLAGPDDFTPPTTQTAQLADAPETGADQDDSVLAKKGGKTGYLKIVLTDILISN